MKNANDKAVGDSIKEKVNALYELMKHEKLEELEIKEENFYLYLKRKSRNMPAAAVSPAPKSVPAESLEEAPALAGLTIRSPITGIFYRAPSPSLPPFVKEGDTANTGKVLCIIEAMKVMNEIKADSTIKILKILVENGKPVNAGQDLFLIER